MKKNREKLDFFLLRKEKDSERFSVEAQKLYKLHFFASLIIRPQRPLNHQWQIKLQGLIIQGL